MPGTGTSHAYLSHDYYSQPQIRNLYNEIISKSRFQFYVYFLLCELLFYFDNGSQYRA